MSHHRQRPASIDSNVDEPQACQHCQAGVTDVIAGQTMHAHAPGCPEFDTTMDRLRVVLSNVMADLRAERCTPAQANAIAARAGKAMDECEQRMRRR